MPAPNKNSQSSQRPLWENSLLALVGGSADMTQGFAGNVAAASDFLVQKGEAAPPFVEPPAKSIPTMVYDALFGDPIQQRRQVLLNSAQHAKQLLPVVKPVRDEAQRVFDMAKSVGQDMSNILPASYQPIRTVMGATPSLLLSGPGKIKAIASPTVDVMQQVGKDGSLSLENAVLNAVTPGNNLWTNIAGQMVQEGISGFRAQGGPVLKGRNYIVGENAIELLTDGKKTEPVGLQGPELIRPHKDMEVIALAPVNSKTYNVESPVTGQIWKINFEGEPSLNDIEEAAKHFDNEWWQQQGIEPGSAITQQTPLSTVGRSMSDPSRMNDIAMRRMRSAGDFQDAAKLAQSQQWLDARYGRGLPMPAMATGGLPATMPQPAPMAPLPPGGRLVPGRSAGSMVWQPDAPPVIDVAPEMPPPAMALPSRSAAPAMSPEPPALPAPLMGLNPLTGLPLDFNQQPPATV